MRTIKYDDDRESEWNKSFVLTFIHLMPKKIIFYDIILKFYARLADEKNSFNGDV